MGLKEQYRLKKIIKEMHELRCKIKKSCENGGGGGDGLTCDDLENCQEIIDIKDSIPSDISDLTDVQELLFSGDYNDLDNKPTIPTNNSELVNDSGYLVCDDLENCQEIIDIKDSIPSDISDLTDVQELLFSGDYNDLDNKPTIPSDISDLTDTNGILLEYKGELTSAPSSPQKGWFYKNTNDGVMYYFDGANWIAYAGGTNILIERSLPDLYADISNADLVQGATYKITGVHRGHTVNSVSVPALYDDGLDLGTTIFLKAISENELESSGSGVFYNPKYDRQVQGYGIWSANAPNYNVDDVVFWGGYAWKNLNGSIGSAVDDLTLNGEWEKLDYTNDTYYNRVIDVIEYDIEHDVITRRRDVRNEIDVTWAFDDVRATQRNIINIMQWGNDFYNIDGLGKISIKHSSYTALVNFSGLMMRNITIDNGGGIPNITLDNFGSMQNITIDNGGGMQNITIDNGGVMQNITIDNGGGMQNITLDNFGGMYGITFDNFRANFGNIIYSGKIFRDIKFKGRVGVTYNIPDLNSATIIFDASKTNKEVFDDGQGNLKISYVDNGSLYIADITD